MKNYLGLEPCSCGKNHNVSIDDIIIGNGVIFQIPEILKRYQVERPFIIADHNTFKAAGKALCEILKKAGIEYLKYIFDDTKLKPDEHSVGSAIMHFREQCDIIIVVGAGVLNDIGKILSNISHRKYMVVATAPSMDGYASETSSMDLDGLKVSLPSRCADVIIGDIDVLKQAPIKMLKAGIGDMLAKYISIAEWRIANIVVGEYYCENIAALVRSAVKKCVDHAEGLLKREDAAVQAVFEGLIIGGVAMAYAGVSRPASGVEHYFSHIWDMRNLEFGTSSDFHGIQCGVGTLFAAKIYDKLLEMAPDREKAERYVREFDFNAYKELLQGFIGAGARPMIDAEKKERKYDLENHKKRFAVIEEHWDDIVEIIKEEIPRATELEKLLDSIEIPKSCTEFGISEEEIKTTFIVTKDIRDKYVLSRLCFDLGIMEDIGF